MNLPVQKDPNKNFMLMQTQWAQALNPVISLPPNQGQILPNVALVNGTTLVSHKLGRKLQGWIPVRWHGGTAAVYDTQDANANPDKTLSLVSNAAVTVDLWVF